MECEEARANRIIAIATLVAVSLREEGSRYLTYMIEPEMASPSVLPRLRTKLSTD